MTPVERQNSIEKGLPYDRVPCVPFIGNMRCLLLGIGPKVYEKFVYPYTKELTDYIYEKTGKKASLHMCGETYSIWKYIKQYQLNEISLDNVVDLERAANELANMCQLQEMWIRYRQ